MVNSIQLIWKLACMLRTYRTYNSTVVFSKYEFNNKLLGGVTLLRVTLGVTWTQLIYYKATCFIGRLGERNEYYVIIFKNDIIVFHVMIMWKKKTPPFNRCISINVGIDDFCH